MHCTWLVGAPNNRLPDCVHMHGPCWLQSASELQVEPMRRRSCLRSLLCTPLRRYTSRLGAAASVSSSKRRKGRSGMVCQNEPAAKVEKGCGAVPRAPNRTYDSTGTARTRVLLY